MGKGKIYFKEKPAYVLIPKERYDELIECKIRFEAKLLMAISDYCDRIDDNYEYLNQKRHEYIKRVNANMSLTRRCFYASIALNVLLAASMIVHGLLK